MLVNGKLTLPRSKEKNLNISKIKEKVDEYLSNMLFDKNKYSVKCSLDENDKTKLNVDIVPFPSLDLINVNLIINSPPKLEKEAYEIKFIKNKFNLNIKKRSVWLSYKSILDFISKYYPQDYYDVEEFIYNNI